jgi:hypothetical protein
MSYDPPTCKKPIWADPNGDGRKRAEFTPSRALRRDQEKRGLVRYCTQWAGHPGACMAPYDVKALIAFWRQNPPLKALEEEELEED